MIIKIIIIGLFGGIIVLAIAKRVLNGKLGNRLALLKKIVSKSSLFVGWLIFSLFIISFCYVHFFITPEIESGRTLKLFKNTK